MTEGRLMELDDLKTTWRSLDARLERQNRLAWENLKDRRLEKARSGLRPLFWGQVLQILIGIPVIGLGIVIWSRHPDVASLVAAGLILHAYGVLMIMFAGRTLWHISRIDYAAPVVAIQRQLAELRRAYAVSGMVVGLSWWLMWMPFLMALVGLVGVDVFARAPLVIYSGTAIGITGLLLTWWFHRWARDPSRPRLAKFMEDSMTGRSLLKAQAVLDDVKRFEEEGS